MLVIRNGNAPGRKPPNHDQLRMGPPLSKKNGLPSSLSITILWSVPSMNGLASAKPTTIHTAALTITKSIIHAINLSTHLARIISLGAAASPAPPPLLLLGSSGELGGGIWSLM